jgi:hypothetical protein
MNAYRESMLSIFRDFLELKPPDDQALFFSYDIIDKVKSTKLFPSRAEYLAYDLMEIINCYHDWTIRLQSWRTWNQILKGYSDNEKKAWEIRHEFLEPTAFFCLHQPASFKDLLIKYCTMSFHFGNLERNPEYKDELEEDKEIFRRLQNNHSQPYDYFLSRSKAIDQLVKLSGSWAMAKKILDDLTELDSKTYKDKSKNWRNSSAHYIAPRLQFGDVRPVTRYVSFHEQLVYQPDGTVSISEDKTRKQIFYGFGGTGPLNLEEIYEINTKQNKIVYGIISSIHELLDEIISFDMMKRKNSCEVSSHITLPTGFAASRNEFGGFKA